MIRRYQQCLYLTGKFADLSQTCLDMPLNQQITLPDNLGTICATHNAIGILVNWNEKQVQLADTQEPIQIRFAYAGKVKRQHNRPAETMKKFGKSSVFRLGNEIAFHSFFMVRLYKVRWGFSVFFRT